MKLRFVLSLLTCYFATTAGFPLEKGADYKITTVPKHVSRSETEHKIPVVPRESRAQYYIKNDDGTFTYGYDTGSGIYEMAEKTGVSDVKGIYGFSYPDGRTTKVSYIAGGGRGFVPKIEESPHEIKENTSSNLGSSFPKQNFGLKSDSSYSFSYENDRSARSETADADLNVRGSYSFVADDGIRRTVNYKAGSGTGFVVDADFISAEDKIPAPKRPSPFRPQPVLKYDSRGEGIGDFKDLKPDGSYSFQYRNDDSSRKEKADSDLNVEGEYSFVADDGIRRTGNNKAGSGTGFVVDADFISAEDKIPAPKRPSPFRPQPVLKYDSRGEDIGDFKNLKPDGSYSFQYRNDDSSRKEKADSDLNVEGEYSFVADDGIRRTVNYKAGSGTGFVVDADFISAEDKIPAPKRPSPFRPQPVLKYDSRGEGIGDFKDLKPDGSYSFQYRNDDSSRKEKAHSDLNVEGEYSFVADDGIRRTGNYKAGSGTGFVVDADFISAEDKIPAPKRPSPFRPQPVLKYDSRGDDIGDFKDLKPDGSYSFQYRNDDSSRKEKADSDLNVEGVYSFVAGDGIRRTVNYKAGSGTGFVVDADFISAEDKIPAPKRPSPFRPQPGLKYDSRGEDIGDFKDLKPDGSYSFQYRNDDSSRKEKADSDLNVEGEYSFVADDGIRRTVNYKAGSGTGFVVDADFISDEDKIPAPKRSSPFRPQPVLKYDSRGEDIGDFKDLKPDGSYSLQYRNDDSSRKETVDAPSARQVFLHKHASTFNAKPVLKPSPLIDEHGKIDDSKFDGSYRAYQLTKDRPRSRKEIVSTDLISRNEYSFVDYHGVKKINSDATESGNLFSPQTKSSFRSARDYQKFMTTAQKDELITSDAKEPNRDSTIYPEKESVIQNKSGEQIINRNKSSLEPSSSSTKYLVGNVLLKKYTTGPERGYVFTAE